MSKLADLVSHIELPKMIEMTQIFPRPRIKDVAEEVKMQLNNSGIGMRIQPGNRIAITGGSRGIANIALIIKEIAAFVKVQGGEPFIIPAMGSHGGATAEGQMDILHSL